MSFAGALVAGLAIAQTSLDGAHVNVDMLTQVLHPQQRDVVLVFTKLVGTAIFALLAWALFLKGTDLYKMKEVSQTLHAPYYPIAYGLSFCSLVECLVLIFDILKTIFPGEEHE
jgi:TRAP-type C4-dicarboxylate transport system permease small subunit